MKRDFLALTTTAVIIFAASVSSSALAGKQCPMDGEGKACCKQNKPEVLSAKEVNNSPAVKAYKQASEGMHQDMNIFYTGDVDTDFVRGMIPHHQGAVDMAKVVLKYGRDETVRSLAEWIVFAQNQEIAQMQHWLTRKGAAKGEKVSHYNADSVQAYEQAMHKMHGDMDIVYSGDPDVDFVLGMIPHHQGAIDMAKVTLKHGRDPEVNALSENIIRTQNGEIAKMQRWLKAQGIECAKSYQKQVASERRGLPTKSKQKHSNQQHHHH